MSDTFKPGDVVVCINDDPCPVFGPTEYVKGRIYEVTEVRSGKCKRTGVYGTGIRCAGVGERWRIAEYFRHLPRATEEFAAQIRACKPIREQVQA